MTNARSPSDTAMVRVLAHALATYALQPRDACPSVLGHGNDARDALALLIGRDVHDLEPGKIDAATLRHRIGAACQERAKKS